MIADQSRGNPLIATVVARFDASPARLRLGLNWLLDSPDHPRNAHAHLTATLAGDQTDGELPAMCHCGRCSPAPCPAAHWRIRITGIR